MHATIGLEVLPPVRYCLYAKYKQNGQFLYNQFDKSDLAVKNDDIQSLDDTVMSPPHTHTRLTTLFQDYPGELVPKVKPIWIF